MAKGQKRSNKEIRKPKQVKTAPAPVALFEKGTSMNSAAAKKKS